MSELELQREEWIEERTAILVYSAGYSEEGAKEAAVAQWDAMQELAGKPE